MLSRLPKKTRSIRRNLLSRLNSFNNLQYIYAQSEYSYQPGPSFEELDAGLGINLEPSAKVIAFYLPQFHEFEENNRNWGSGFTEWTTLPRQIPRFRGHIAPRIPRDLGYYDLTKPGVQERQAKIAKDAGVFGFCYYYYRFDGRGFMDAPLERMLQTPAVDIPFCVMWCNETWTRAWEGKGRAVIARQNYSGALDVDLVDDLARLFRDPRYIRIGSRPLLVIYRPTFLPDGPRRVERLRDLFISRHGVEPLITMAQTDEGSDPRPFAMDGAVEFVANKFKGKIKSAVRPFEFFDDKHSKGVFDYDHLVELSLAEPVPDFPLVRSVLPSWDNNPRRPGRGSVIHGSTPKKFQAWVSKAIEYAIANSFYGDRIVFVTAWNEWAESAYLEPDTHHGGAYLNALARAVFRCK